MSQIFTRTTAGNLPPSVATSYETQNGTAVPLANVLKVYGYDSNIDNDNGIIINGGVVGTGTQNEVDVVLTNRVTGSVTTTDATPTTLATVSLGVDPGVFYSSGNILAYNTTDSEGASWSFSGSAVTTGVAGTEIGTDQKDAFKQTTLATAAFNFSISGNNATIVVTGVAGKTINWNCLFNYRFVG